MKTKLEDSDVAFQYREYMENIIRDLKNIDKMIPRETSRIGCLMRPGNASAIIESRKSELLGYIQTICRDHIHWCQPLLDKGWTAKQWKYKWPGCSTVPHRMRPGQIIGEHSEKVKGRRKTARNRKASKLSARSKRGFSVRPKKA